MAPLPNPRALGKAIAEERRSKGLTQKEVVDRISTFYSDDRAYRRVESGQRLPDRDALIAILGSGLSIDGADKINSILALGSYAPLTGAEVQQLSVISIPASASLPPATPSGGSFWNRLSGKTHFKSAGAVAVCSLALAGVIAAMSQETVILLVTGSLYACLYAVSVLLESVFNPNPGPRWPVTSAVFGFVLVASVMALALDAWLARIGTAAALPLSLAVYLISAMVQWAIARAILSEAALVPLGFRGHTSQTAHLKNTVYYLIIVVLFWLPPFHCITVLRREIQTGHVPWVKAILANRLLLGRDFVSFNAEPLWYAFLFLLVLALPMAARLLENLKTDNPKLNGYTALLYLRGILYFLLILICLIWYSSAIGSLSS